jgi:hypothetical protein
VTPAPRRTTVPAALLAVAVAALAAAPGAMAADGLGWMGRVNDLEITLFCFGVIALFPILITVLSLIQGRLEARKEQRRYDLERLG